MIFDTEFAPVKNLTVGAFRDWLLRYETDDKVLSALAPGLTPEMAKANLHPFDRGVPARGRSLTRTAFRSNSCRFSRQSATSPATSAIAPGSDGGGMVARHISTKRMTIGDEKHPNR